MAASEEKKKIFIIDDEPDTVDFLSMLFEDGGFSVIAATNPDRAFDIITAEKPDLITLDILMPHKTGARFYNELRTRTEFAEIPVVVISGVEPGDYMRDIPGGKRQNSEIPGPDAFIEKPVDSAFLLDTIQKILSC